MAVKLRLMRIGKRNRPCYRLCAVDSRTHRGGEYLENLGFYDPSIEDDQKKVQIHRQRAEYWLSVGAQPTETVRSFFRKAHILGLARPEKPAHKRPKLSEAGRKKAIADAKARRTKAKAKAQAAKAKAQAKKKAKEKEAEKKE